MVHYDFSCTWSLDTAQVGGVKGVVRLLFLITFKIKIMVYVVIPEAFKEH